MAPLAGGNAEFMIGLALGAIVVGIVLLFILPWAGAPIAAVGLILAIVYFTGWVRRAAQGRP